VAVLHLQVVEGEATVHSPGSRSSRPLTVEVTDETGQPVEGASVSFHTPIDGPTGVFSSGLRTEILRTDVHGRASLRGLQLNKTSGRFLIRIVASKEQASAGALASQYISESKSGATQATAKSGHGNSKWLALAAMLGGGAVAGYYVTARSSGFATTTSNPSALSVGNPSITVGKP
jgi:hypothetical protein